MGAFFFLSYSPCSPAVLAHPFSPSPSSSSSRATVHVRWAPVARLLRLPTRTSVVLDTSLLSFLPSFSLSPSSSVALFSSPLERPSYTESPAIGGSGSLAFRCPPSLCRTRRHGRPIGSARTAMPISGSEESREARSSEENERERDRCRRFLTIRRRGIPIQMR